MEPSQKPSLSALPMELLEAISEGLDEDDLLVLRMTCSALNTKLHELHLNSIYNTRRLFLVPTSVENLLKVSKSTMNTRVRQIVISSGTPFEFPFIDPDDMDEKNYALALKIWEEMRNDEVALMMETDSRRLTEFDETGSLLYLAFSNLPNLRKISFERSAGSHGDMNSRFMRVKRSEINLFFPGAGLSPGHHMVRGLNGEGIFTLGWEQYGDSKFVCTILHSAMLAGLPHLEAISDRPGSRGIPLRWFDVSPKKLAAYRESFPNLRTLELVINFDKETNAGGGIMPYQTDRWNKLFCQWLEVVGSKLELLKLNLFEQSGPADIPFLLSAETGLPNLKSIVMEKAVIDLEDITKFLACCKNNLESLRFADCLFRDPNDDWFQLLQYLKQETPKLQSFAFTLFFEYDAYKRIKDVPFVLPSSFVVQGPWESETTECEINLGFRAPETHSSRWCYKTSKVISKELAAHTEHDSFWMSITDGKCAEEAVKWHEDRFSYERRWLKSSWY
ncbi:hypothetical protein TWF694_006877 [Orbilia ellipsospora]|uniref:F-box domain-containing protein n=1 Tax=Orbilia ellipsospora TaxID=2528407 RepID=A0AAV9XP32_9PEZI